MSQLEASKQKSSSDGELLKVTLLTAPQQDAPRGAGRYKGLQCDQKYPNPTVQACTHAENNPTLLITTSIEKINHTFQTRKITRVCDEVSWYLGDHCLSSLSSFLQREST